MKKSLLGINMMYLPALILFAAFIFYPFMNGIRISFTNWDGYSQNSAWVGLANYKRLFTDPNIGTVVKNTLTYGLGSTILQNLFGLLYALLLNQSIKGRGIVRTIIYLPVIISPLIMGYIWYFIFQMNGGALNDLVKLFGGDPVNFLANPQLNVWLITLVNTFQFVGTAMIIYLAGLQSISADYYEAASLTARPLGSVSRMSPSSASPVNHYQCGH